MCHYSSTSAVVATLVLHLLATMNAAHSIGVNYGTLRNNLPPPAQVATFIKDKTTIDRIKIFNVNAVILRAFANTTILVAVTVPNHEIPNLTDPQTARRWITSNIKPFYPQTKINYILVGNEILHWGAQNLIDNLVPAMRTLHEAIKKEGIDEIKVTTAHSLGILEPSDVPSTAKFRPGWDMAILSPMLQFHRDTKSPFMVNPYPFHAYTQDNADFSLFRSNQGVYDPNNKIIYRNMMNLLLDSVYVSMKNLGFPDVEIVVGETGWASKGDIQEQPKCSVVNARSFNRGLVKHYEDGLGTPLMPHRRFETYIFALFNENEKPGPLSERNFGLFQPDFTPVYNIGITRAGAAAAAPPPTMATMMVPWFIFIFLGEFWMKNVE